MTSERVDPSAQPGKEKTLRGNEGSTVPPAASLPNVPLSTSGRPEGNPGCVDVTGVMPEGIVIDPDITQGHPGYEESGDSEIIPPERLARRGTAAQEDH
jgi:hypothetical protein